MLFHSFRFIFGFLPATLLLYYLCGVFFQNQVATLRKWLLIALSVLYFLPFGTYPLLALCCSLVFNALVARALRGAREKKILLAFGVVVNIAALTFFKVGAFPLPLAMSFYTFTQIAFLVDTADETAKPETLSDYLFHVLFFPKLLQGPILRYAQTKEYALDRLNARLSAKNLLTGLTLFSIGLWKKVLLADTLAKTIDTAYELIPHLTRSDAWIAILTYALLLYFDFSGYCDMGMGVAQMLGLDLPDNFHAPLRAENISDFWNRWHISLSDFFIRYVYVPLGGSRNGAFNRYCNIMIVFLLSGFWHGAGWTYLVWGALNGLGCVVVAATGKRVALPRVFSSCFSRRTPRGRQRRSGRAQS